MHLFFSIDAVKGVYSFSVIDILAYQVRVNKMKVLDENTLKVLDLLTIIYRSYTSRE